MLGQKATDSISGIRGTVTATSEHLYGESRVCIEYVKDQEIKVIWVDVKRVKIMTPTS